MYESAAMCQGVCGVFFWLSCRNRAIRADRCADRRATLFSSAANRRQRGIFSFLQEIFLVLSAPKTELVSSPICSCFRFRREPCIRPDCGHEHIGLGFRIHPETSSPVVRWRRARRVSRLPVPGRNLVLTRSPIRLLLAKDPVAGLCKMTGDGDDSTAVPTLGEEPLIEATDVG